MNTQQNLEMKLSRILALGIITFIFILILPAELFAQGPASTFELYRVKKDHLEALVKSQQDKVQTHSLLEGNSADRYYVNVLHFPDKAELCHLEINSMAPYGPDGDYARKVTIIDLAQLTDYPTLQPKEKPGLFNNAVNFGHQLFYLPNDYSEHKGQELIQNLKNLIVSCRQLSFLNAGRAVERKAQELTDKLTSKGEKYFYSYCKLAEVSELEKLENQLLDVIQTTANQDFDQVEFLHGDMLFNVPL